MMNFKSQTRKIKKQKRWRCRNLWGSKKLVHIFGLGEKLCFKKENKTQQKQKNKIIKLWIKEESTRVFYRVQC